ERLGLPGKSPPPPPPKRARLRRSRSSSAETLPAPRPGRRPRRGGSPHGPEEPSSAGGSPSPPLFWPQGPLVSVNKPRKRPPHPDIVVIGGEYRALPHEKQWQDPWCFLCARDGPCRGPADRPAARRADPLAQAVGRRRDDHRR